MTKQKLSFLAVSADEGKRLLHFLREKGISSTLIRALKGEGGIRVNDKLAFVKELVREGDRIDLFFPEESSEGVLPEPVSFEILYEDEDLLIINKPAGIAIHPTFSYSGGTLANGVVHYWQKKGVTYRFRPVNRLDKDTSGIVVVALHAYAQYHLSQQQKSGEMVKRYLAITHGKILESSGKILDPIGRKDDSIIERQVRPDGQSAITLYRVKRIYQEATVVEVELVTGRTHQIRVHFSHLGYPLLGDDLYGGSRNLISRQALHAAYLSFLHPRTGILMEIEAPIPMDMEAVLNRLER